MSKPNGAEAAGFMEQFNFISDYCWCGTKQHQLILRLRVHENKSVENIEAVFCP